MSDLPSESYRINETEIMVQVSHRDYNDFAFNNDDLEILTNGLLSLLSFLIESSLPQSIAVNQRYFDK